jgi:hypothetical protein
MMDGNIIAVVIAIVFFIAGLWTGHLITKHGKDSE